MIGPEFGTVSRPDLAAAAREAAEFRFDTLIACAFSYDAACSDLDQLGRMRVLKARMNADLHMATDLKQTEAGNLFVVFGEPDIRIHDEADDEISVEVRGIDVFDPGQGRDSERRCGRNRLLVHRHRLRRGELLRPPCVLPGREGPLQEPEDVAQGRGRQGGLGVAPQSAVTALPQARTGGSRSRSSIISGMRR